MSRKFQILIIDDNPIEVMVLKKTFSNINADCSLMEFGDAEMALTYLEKVKSENVVPLPDIIISDLLLPKMSGNELLAALKGDETLKKIPFVIFTNSSSEMDVKLAYSYNVNSYIIKPLNLDVYKETILSFWNFWANAVRLPDHQALSRKAA